MLKTIDIMECKETEKNGIYWSEEVGIKVSQTKITSIAKSKFKGDPFQQRLENPDNPEETKGFRCLRFKTKYLDRIKAKYVIPDKINLVSPVSPVSLTRGILSYYSDIMTTKITAKVKNCFENTLKNIENIPIVVDDKDPKGLNIPLKSDTPDTSDTETKGEGLGNK